MKEIGGYIEFETYHGSMLHSDGILLNCGRNCLAYLICARQIKKIRMPYFMCSSVIHVCRKYGVQIRFYHVGIDFRPQRMELGDSEWLYLMNFYGQISREELEEAGKKYKRVIVDFAHDYFQEPIAGLDTIYTCRKFFGVSDGAVLYTDADPVIGLETDESHERIHYLCGRFECPAAEFYEEASSNNEFFDREPVRKMSRFTLNLLHGIDYERIKGARTQNFIFLHKQLKNMNQLKLHMIEGAYAYPLMLKNGMEIKKKMAAQKIYVPTLWPNVLEDMPDGSLEYRMASDILPLPCDQRYDQDDMGRIAAAIMNLADDWR
ncbi:hypothetical protein D3Z60_09190 [Lachnospiraceae bacterium]|nr:hypothetical protein [Lachnospiraceae bacterium]